MERERIRLQTVGPEIQRTGTTVIETARVVRTIRK